MNNPTLSTVLLAAVAGCASASVPPARFANAKPIQTVDDQRDVPRPPREHEIVNALYHYDGTFHRRITRGLEVPRARRALSVNALDEVPDSTWFTNRIGIRDLTLDELRKGPAMIGNPEAHLPWTIHTTKTVGKSLGLFVTDSRGERFLIKFDRSGFPELETAAQVITGRLLWACGYNVTDDYIARVLPGDFRIASDATTRDDVGDKRGFGTADLEAVLARVERAADGRVRVMASHIIDGKSLGGHSGEGIRHDDPNDRIAHELRRDLRGAMPIFAWLDHSDLKDANTLDTWIADPENPQHHYVKHYFLDFGMSLGALALVYRDYRRSAEYGVDFAAMWGSLLTFGLRPQPYKSREAPPLRGIGLLETYTPRTWRPYTPAYLPYHTSDRLDWFWGAKILMRFTPEQIRAVVDTGELSDPRSAAYLTNILVDRQRATASYAFSQVSPLDHVEVAYGPSLCFQDLMLVYGLTKEPTSYAVRSFDRKGQAFGATRVRGASGGRTCTAPVDIATAGDGYTIVEIETRRNGAAHSLFVHVAREPNSNNLRVIGIWRE